MTLKELSATFSSPSSSSVPSVPLVYTLIFVMPVFLGRTIALNMTVFQFFPFVSAFSP
ncbi:hypothetical protein ARMGADRAFT_343947 [Armillaria gallica]|uniref:Uncharacterized protein n=1 Tax=Armillaria gallica TaxID=47427 RepID=A0A2H3DK45_ARMGA|nr:hypothetical protein ARMGADRAFT_343947 [Armillaria gallica]